MADTIRWGILGPGGIARKFAEGLDALPDACLTAVGSRSQKRANAFADEFGAPNRHDSYAALAGDPDVDAVYVATPHPYHCENTILCLNAGKAVLCEKPFAVNAGEVKDMIACARSNGVFLMEAMWTRWLPNVVKVREWLADGAIGDVRMLLIDFGFRCGWNPESRLLNPDLAGGALLDVGIYTVSFASMVFGRAPACIASVGHIGETGVDEQAGMLLGYDGGGQAVLSTAIRTNTYQLARIHGTDGMIEVPAFWRGTSAVLRRNGKSEEVFDETRIGSGYNHEAEEVGRCLRNGDLESAILPLDESLAIMKTMDIIRDQIGVKYPFE